MPLFRATTALQGEAAARALSDALDGLDPAPLASEVHDHDDGSGLWDAGGLFDAPPDAAGLALLARLHGAPDFAVARVEDRDWVAQVRAELTPVEAGRFVVYGSHDRERVAANRVRLEIEAAQAFGTGHHATTQGCLLALDRLVQARAGGAAGRRHRRRDRRARHGGGLGLAGDGDRRRHRPAGDRDGAGERGGERARGPGRLRDGGRVPPPAAARRGALSTSSSPTSWPGRCGGWRRSWRRITPRGAWRSCRGSWRGRPAGVTAVYRSWGYVPEEPVRIGEWVTLVLRRGA